MSTLEGLLSLEQAHGDNNLYRVDNSGYLANEDYYCMSLIRSRIRGLQKTNLIFQQHISWYCVKIICQCVLFIELTQQFILNRKEEISPEKPYQYTVTTKLFLIGQNF